MSRAIDFEGEVLAGHKGAAVACPVDPAAEWNAPSVSLQPGRRGWRVRGTIAGIEFASAVVARSKRFWLLLDDALLRSAGASVGDTVKVHLEPLGKNLPGFDPLAFLKRHGIVLVSGKGPVPRLSEAIAGEAVRGSWWAHPQGKAIFDALQVLANAPDALFCKLVDGKQTLVHRRLWPALARCAAAFPADRLARVQQEHTASGAHRNVLTPFPDWLPAEVDREAGALTEAVARAALAAAGVVPAAK